MAQGQIEALKTDMEAAKPLLAQDKDHLAMEISGKVYTERKEAGAAIIEACKALKAAGTEGRIGSYGAFELHSRFDNFDKVFRLSIKGAWNYSMELSYVDTYFDNGFTGTNFKRPAFTRLMNDVRQKKIKCIVVKDLSRFGRNYLEAGYYIETVFPFLGVRLIAVTDNFDSTRKEDIVSDYEKAREFYVNKLGFAVVRENFRKERNDWKLDLRVGDGADAIELEIFAEPNPPERVNRPEASLKMY